MAKKNKKETGGKIHNKIASIAIILFGLLLTILGFIQPYMDGLIRGIIITGLILVVLGGILFKKSFLNK